MGVPDNALALQQKPSMHCMSLSKQGGVDILPVVPGRGFVQGSVSGPEQAKPAQDLILLI